LLGFGHGASHDDIFDLLGVNPNALNEGFQNSPSHIIWTGMDEGSAIGFSDGGATRANDDGFSHK
jgi:hypothetical protein